jgi:hypothetical protein
LEQTLGPEDRAEPADANAGTLSPDRPLTPDPGKEPERHDVPEQDAELRPEEAGEPKQPDGEKPAEPAQKTEPEPAQRRKPRSQQRIEQLTAQVGDLQRQVEHFRTLAERSGPPRKLDPLSFNSDAEYQRAVIAETAKQSQAEFAKGQAQAAARQAQIIEQQIWDARVADYREEVPDFDAVAYAPTTNYGSERVVNMVRQMAEGPQVAYYLAKNQAEAQRFATMTPLETAFELGRIAQRLQGPPVKKVSQAPNPVPTVRARCAATGYRPDSNDPDAYAAWRDKLK